MTYIFGELQPFRYLSGPPPKEGVVTNPLRVGIIEWRFFSELQSTILVLNLASKGWMSIVPHSKCASGVRVRSSLGPNSTNPAGSNLAVCLRAGPELLGTVAWGGGGRESAWNRPTGPFRAASARFSRLAHSGFRAAESRFLGKAT